MHSIRLTYQAQRGFFIFLTVNQGLSLDIPWIPHGFRASTCCLKEIRCRVHRIRQKRGVHGFKLVTEGTLEEKISAIIEKKGKLMERVIKEDDPGLLKSFSREDLIDLLSIPTQHEMRDTLYDIE